MIQLNFFREKEKINPTACVFTGHRHLDADFSLKKLKKHIEAVIKDGVTEFYNGMALGFDLIAAQTVLSLKKKYPSVKLIACIPCKDQDKYFSIEDKRLYHELLEKADERILISENYHKGCMLQRNRYMADKSDIMIAYCNKPTGGTAYTVKYFQKIHPDSKILFI